MGSGQGPQQSIPSVLYAGRMFSGHPGEARYDAVDGVGYLLLALLYLQARQAPPDMGFAF